jgi:hypothetical protein
VCYGSCWDGRCLSDKVGSGVASDWVRSRDSCPIKLGLWVFSMSQTLEQDKPSSQ